MRSVLVVFFVLLLSGKLGAQQNSSLSFEEYLEYVKANHPLVTQANNKESSGLAQLLKARGAFDPKLSYENDQKDFDGSQYYERSKGAIVVPAWYGLSLKAGFAQNQGLYLNNQDQLPDGGLYQAGIALDASDGLWINKRMATLKQAKLLVSQTQAERELLINSLIAEAASAYFDWLLAHDNYQVSDQFYVNALRRFEGVRQRALAGDLANIDTLESYTNVQQRLLERSEASLKLLSSRLEASNYLWEKNTVPLEILEGTHPAPIDGVALDQILGLTTAFLDADLIGAHPKISVLNAKLGISEYEGSLKAAALMPDIKLNFNLLQREVDDFIPINLDQNKANLAVKLPLFLRKERGELKLAKLKISDADMDLQFEKIKIKNKITENIQAQDLLFDQYGLSKNMVVNYEALLQGEQRKFNEGESALFVLISREQKLIEALRKRNTVENKFYKSKIGLYKALALVPE